MKDLKRRRDENNDPDKSPSKKIKQGIDDKDGKRKSSPERERKKEKKSKRSKEEKRRQKELKQAKKEIVSIPELEEEIGNLIM